MIYIYKQKFAFICFRRQFFLVFLWSYNLPSGVISSEMKFMFSETHHHPPSWRWILVLYQNFKNWNKTYKTFCFLSKKKTLKKFIAVCLKQIKHFLKFWFFFYIVYRKIWLDFTGCETRFSHPHENREKGVLFQL